MTTASTIVQRVAEEAKARLSARQCYARDVLDGRQAWSGADLRGAASTWGGSYARQRGKAAQALRAAGGVILPGENNRLCTAVLIGTDDYGNAVYATRHGFAAPNRTGKQLHAL